MPVKEWPIRMAILDHCGCDEDDVSRWRLKDNALYVPETAIIRSKLFEKASNADRARIKEEVNSLQRSIGFITNPFTSFRKFPFEGKPQVVQAVRSGIELASIAEQIASATGEPNDFDVMFSPALQIAYPGFMYNEKFRENFEANIWCPPSWQQIWDTMLPNDKGKRTISIGVQIIAPDTSMQFTQSNVYSLLTAFEE